MAKQNKDQKNEKRRISAKGARAKGLQFEREVARAFREIGFLDAGRNLEFQKKHAIGVDIEDAGPFNVQCKRLQRYASITMIQEVKALVGIPVLLTAGNSEKPMAVIPMDDFFRMAEVYLRGMTKAKQEELGWSDPKNFDIGF